ncbi:MAG: hypothetical protein A2Y61_00210 [Chloroflexi bacterium RBG_13_60_13]|nr:MAG: hypothetical protein A2Y61_00210 [Chloroflexi bacterium RBG_13_60_13]
MSATSIFFGGRLIRTPGSYTVVDASGLEQIGLGASGIVAVLGEAEGGKPMSAITEPADLIRLTKPERARELFRSGQLREVADMLFAPSNDPDILGGAVEVVACKVNPATQSTGSLPNAYGDVLDLVSADYGAFTSQVNIAVGAGTNQGKLITITFEDGVESVDDLGGDSMFSVTYVDSGTGWDTMTAEVEAGGAVVCKATRAELGKASEITAQPIGASTIDVKSSSAADVGMQVIVYGLDAAGTAVVSETYVLNGTTLQAGQTIMSKVMGARVIGVTIGTVTATDDDPATILTIAAGTNPETGLVTCADMYVGASALTGVVADGATTKHLAIIGLSKTGAAQIELITLTGAVSVTGVAQWSEIQFIAMGEVEVARTVTFSGEAARTVPATQNTLQKVADYFNARSRTPGATTYGFIYTMNTGLTTLDPDDLDDTSNGAGAVDCLSPAVPDFYADLYAVIDWINNHSQHIVASESSGAAGGAPSNTAAPVFLNGGDEGTTTSQHWQDALNLLKQTRVNSVVVLTHTPAVHAMLDAHCAFMGGVGRDERDGFVGLLNTAGTALAPKADIKSQIINLNSRHIRAFAQAIERYNTAGERQEFEPYYLAAVAAGMQAGSSVGTSLTYKYANVLNLRQASGAGAWNPTDDSEEMLAAGLCFLENVEGVGRRFVRNITTHLSSSNLAFIEGSVNEAVNFATKALRNNLEMAVGKKGFAGTVNAVKGVAVNTLGLLIDNQALVAWRALQIELVADVLSVAVEIAPVIPINFVATTVHLITLRQTA